MLTTVLTVTFAGETRHVRERLTFGRQAELELDTNAQLHRRVGEFVRLDGSWWLKNLGSRLFITSVSDDGTRTDLAPGSRQILVGRSGSVRVAVGPARYEIGYDIDEMQHGDVRPDDDSGGATTDFQPILTPREVDFLVSFARPILEGRNVPIPSYVVVANLWGVSTKTLDNTLQSVKRKLRNASMARDEPLDTMVRVVIAHSLITHDDLRWAFDADAPDGDVPRPAAEGPRFAPPDG